MAKSHGRSGDEEGGAVAGNGDHPSCNGVSNPRFCADMTEGEGANGGRDGAEAPLDKLRRGCIVLVQSKGRVGLVHALSWVHAERHRAIRH